MELAEYLFRRLYQIGIRSVHGVPGDYNLNCLDFIPRAGLKWIGNVNELEAGALPFVSPKKDLAPNDPQLMYHLYPIGYAADGYARINGASALITTFGVGELSASNAIAGAYAEHVPIIHIVGTPPRAAQEAGKVMHHTLGNGDYSAFPKMSERIACLVTDLRHSGASVRAIDEAIRECLVRSRPVYIYIPVDMVFSKVDGEVLKELIDLELPYDEREGAEVLQLVLKDLDSAKRPAILVDHDAIMYKALEEVRDLVVRSGCPVFVTPMGRSAVDETLENFTGVYEGDSSQSAVKEHLESSDFILGIGIVPSDYNTGGFTHEGIKDALRVLIQGFRAKVHSRSFESVNMRRILREMSSKVQRRTLWTSGAIVDKSMSAKQGTVENTAEITHQWLWPQLTAWLQERDIVVTETGTSNFGISMTRLPKDAIAINQVLWGSIGYALAATEGAAMAAKEAGLKRTILFTGDGSFQLTVTALSTMIRYELSPIIFVICNKGYTVERYVHGWEASYNDIKSWNYTMLPKAFDSEKMARTHQVKSRQELKELLQTEDFKNPQRLQLVELWMSKEDAPTGLKKTGQAVKQNAG